MLHITKQIIEMLLFKRITQCTRHVYSS